MPDENGKSILHYYVRSLLIVLAALLTVSYSLMDAASSTPMPAPPPGSATATFAGGCFWCMEAPYQEHAGVYDAVAGYAGGTEGTAEYSLVARGITGHKEAVRITYDPAKVSYEDLLAIFWRQIDPTDSGGQFADRGPQYKTAIYYHTEEQKRLAETSKRALEKSGTFDTPIVTEILPLTTFFPAEEEHQDYYRKSAERYENYKKGSGRADFLAENRARETALEHAYRMKTEASPSRRSTCSHVDDPEKGNPAKKYSRPSDAEIRSMLTPEQWRVTQEEYTEHPFDNAYWDTKEDGIYVDRVSGEPLFSSQDKYDSGTGWPSFTKPLEQENIIERRDRRFFAGRTEIRSAISDSHLGHVFDDGPEPMRLRYCMNSAALRFIPKEKLEEEGYGDYADLFR